jgi:hypothetical protein
MSTATAAEVCPHALDDLDVGRSSDAEARGRIAQVVRRQRLQAGTFDSCVEDVVAEVGVPWLRLSWW